jgi:hypothetical protein
VSDRVVRGDLRGKQGCEAEPCNRRLWSLALTKSTHDGDGEPSAGLGALAKTPNELFDMVVAERGRDEGDKLVRRVPLLGCALHELDRKIKRERSVCKSDLVRQSLEQLRFGKVKPMFLFQKRLSEQLSQRLT